MTTRKPQIRRWAWTAAGLLGGFTVIAGVMHVPSVQYAMGWADANGEVACPFGHDASQPRAPRVVDASLPVAAQRPALGFALDVTTRADLDAWAVQHGVACSAKPRAPRVVACSEVPAVALGSDSLGATTAWFEFGDGDTLASVKTSRRAGTSAPVTSEYRATESRVSQHAGAPVLARNDALATLDAGVFHQAVVEYKFRDYRAVIRATNMGDGYLLTEQYASLLQ